MTASHPPRALAALRAVRAYQAGELAEAEREALTWLGFAPPQRASGDIDRPLPDDARYRRASPALVRARIVQVTGGLRTAAPPCCAESSRLARADTTGFAAMQQPAAPLPRTEAGAAVDERWLLNPLDPSIGFVPCGYDCAAAIGARRATLAGRDLGALRSLLAVRLLRLAPGVELIVTGRETRHGGVAVDGLYSLFFELTGPLSSLVESLVVRRLLAGRELRVLEDAVEVRQGLVFVKMLHPDGARWLDFTQSR